jgi:formylmethanofuran dehydrogenase subunit E
MDAYWIRWQLGISKVSLEMHPFKCGNCKKVTAHREVKRYDSDESPDNPKAIWLMECQTCFEMRLIDPVERIANKEDEITRCDQCGNYKMKAANCRICKIAAGQERITQRYWTGGATLERFVDADI